VPSTWTNTQIVDNLLRTGLKWSGSTITYGFPSSAPSWSFSTGEGQGFSPLTTAQKEAARLAVKLWDDLIAPDFVETTSTTNIKFSNTTTDIGYAHAYYPGSSLASGSVWFNPIYNSSSGTNDLVTPKVGQWGFLAYIHELGHALGLAHPGTYNGGNPTYANDAPYAQDSIMYTVMSYFDASETGADWRASDGKWYYAQTPMLHDVLAIQALYGAENNTRAGDTRYGFNSTAGVSVFDFSQNAHPILTIWDGGGNDWLDLSGFATASRIDLNPGTFSDCDGMTMNVAIAYASDIENAAGGAASDSITGNALANILQGNGGNDTLLGEAGNDTLQGGTGNDLLRGGSGADILLGGDGDDLFYADVSDYLLQFEGGLGYDILYFYGVPTVEFIYADYGLEEMWLLDSSNTIEGTANADVLNGTDLDDTINGLAGNDTLKGGAGDDILSGDQGNDVLDGGLGVDRATYQSATAGVTVSLALTAAQNTVSAGTDTLLGIENLTGSLFNDTLTGSALANILAGLDGDDKLNGGAGADTMIGGNGNDTYTIDNIGDIADETGGSGIDTVDSSVSLNLSSNPASGDIEKLTLTGASHINATGNELANVLTGNGGNNILEGRGGADQLIGGNGSDTASYAASTAAVSVTLSSGVGTGGDAEGDTLSSIENLTGSQFDDTLSGSAGNNVLVGGLGVDTLSYANALKAVTVNLALTSAQNTGGAGTDTISGLENLTGSAYADKLTGASGDNVLNGLAGNDRLTGGAGLDRLIGGAGQDTLTGGLDADQFVFTATTDSAMGSLRDLITDFGIGIDKIDLSGIDAMAGGSDDQFDFVGASGFSGVAGELRSFVSGSQTFVQGDTTGDGVADFQIAMTGALTITETDFIL